MVELDQLLSGICRGLVSAQRELDRAAVEEPPWFVFRNTTVELELSTFVVETKGAEPQLGVRPLDPVAVALRGHAAASGTRVRIEIEPLGADFIDGKV